MYGVIWAKNICQWYLHLMVDPRSILAVDVIFCMPCCNLNQVEIEDNIKHQFCKVWKKSKIAAGFLIHLMILKKIWKWLPWDALFVTTSISKIEYAFLKWTLKCFCCCNILIIFLPSSLCHNIPKNAASFYTFLHYSTLYDRALVN